MSSGILLTKLVNLLLFSATIPKPVNGWLLGNHKVVGFYRVMYDRNMWGMLAHQLMTNHTVRFY